MKHLIESIDQFRLPILCDLPQLKLRLQQPNVAARDLLPLIEHDPVLTLYLQRMAGDRQQGRQGEITGLEHALSMCGIESIAQLVSRLRTPETEASIPFRQVAAESILAAKIAARMAAMKGHNEKEHQAAAFFARAYEWLLYWNHPRRSWQARRMAYRRPWSRDIIFDSLFNIKPDELQLAIAEHCYLPYLNQRIANFSLSSSVRLLLQAVKQFRQGNLVFEDMPRQLRLRLTSPEMTSVIANKLAQAVCSPWLINAWGWWVDIAAIHCRKTTKDIVRLSVNCIQQVAQTRVSFAEFPLASALICEPSPSPYRNYLAQRQAVANAASRNRSRVEKHASKPSTSTKTAGSKANKAFTNTNATRKHSEPTESKVESSSKIRAAKASVKAASGNNLENNRQPVRGKAVQANANEKLTGDNPLRAKKVSRNGSDGAVKESIPVGQGDTLWADYGSKQHARFLSYCRQLAEPNDDCDIKQVLRQTLQQLVELTPLERTSFILLDRQQAMGRTVISASKGDNADMVFSLELDKTPVLKKFIQQPAFLTFDKQKHAKVWPQLPKIIVHPPQVNEFLFHSIRYGGRVRGFLYADIAISNQKIPETLKQDFKYLVKILSARLNQILLRQHEVN